MPTRIRSALASLRPQPGGHGPVGPGRRLLLRKRARSSRSGVALLVVLAAIMVMTVLVTEMSYGARIRMLLAAHQRDEVKAHWLAISGINLYRLILTANYQLKQNSYLNDIAKTYGVNIGDALWQAVPFISTGLLRMVFVSGEDVDDWDRTQVETLLTTGTVSDEVAVESRQQSAFEDEGFLDFDGDFSAEIQDQESKINVGNLANLATGESLLENSTAMQLYGLMSGQENDEWFYQRNLDRWEIIGNLADWMDADNTRCGNYSGYEDDLYNRLDDPYLAKNAKFDTKEEIRLVDGWQDDVYERFGDEITVWGSGKVNVNTASREVLFGLIKSFVAGPPADDFAYQLVDLLESYKTITSFQSASDFTTYLKDQGAEVLDGMTSAITTSSSVFQVTSMGVVGNTAVTITAVLDYQSSSEGKVLYWHVE